MSFRNLILVSAVCMTSFNALASGDDSCEVWFKNSKIKLGADCLMDCSVAKTSMGTFDCTEQCSHFCKLPIATELRFSLASLYGLTTAERAIVAKYPEKALKAYQLSWRAETLCSKLFVVSNTNDESDACRHFVWAGLMVRDLESPFAEQVLNAHEEAARQPEEERAMDLANNRLGLLVFKESPKAASDAEILQSFREQLRKRKLVILKPDPKNLRSSQ